MDLPILDNHAMREPCDPPRPGHDAASKSPATPSFAAHLAPPTTGTTKKNDPGRTEQVEDSPHPRNPIVSDPAQPPAPPHAEKPLTLADDHPPTPQETPAASNQEISVRRSMHPAPSARESQPTRVEHGPAAAIQPEIEPGNGHLTSTQTIAPTEPSQNHATRDQTIPVHAKQIETAEVRTTRADKTQFQTAPIHHAKTTQAEQAQVEAARTPTAQTATEQATTAHVKRARTEKAQAKAAQAETARTETAPTAAAEAQAVTPQAETAQAETAQAETAQAERAQAARARGGTARTGNSDRAPQPTASELAAKPAHEGQSEFLPPLQRTLEPQASRSEDTGKGSLARRVDRRESGPRKTLQQPDKPTARLDGEKNAATQRPTDVPRAELPPRAAGMARTAEISSSSLTPIPDLPLPRAEILEDRAGVEAGEADSKTFVETNRRGSTPLEILPDQLLARGTTRAAHAGEMSQIDQTRLIQRVARAIEAAPQRGGMIRLRLSPPELGSLQMEVSVMKGVLSARLETETELARAALLDNLPQLRARLAEQGVRVEHFEVSVSHRDAGESPNQSRDFREAAASLPAHRTSDTPPDAARDHEQLTTLRRFIHPGNLNIVV